MTTTTSTASGIAGQLTAAETAWFELAFGRVVKLTPNGTTRQGSEARTDVASTYPDAVVDRHPTPRSASGESASDHR